MATKNVITQVQSQNLRLIPVQKMVGELLEMNPQEIEERIGQELDDNPALELSTDEGETSVNQTEDGEEFTEDEHDISDYGGDADEEAFYGDSANEEPIYNRRANNRGPDDEFYQAPVVAEQTLAEYLLDQLHERENLTPTQELIADYIVGAIEDNGYLTRSVSAIASDVTFNGGVEVDDPEVEEVREMVRDLDPAGIAATDLRDCLLLQLDRKPGTAVNRLAYDIVRNDFDNFIKGRDESLCTKYQIEPDMLDQVKQVVHALNVKPASAFSGERSESHQLQIVPDFRVDVDLSTQTLSLTLLNRVPELQISQSFEVENNRLSALSGVTMSRRDKEQAAFIRDRYNSATEFIKVLRMRQETLFLTMRAIMDIQKDYFLSGNPASIRPMRLQDIADVVGRDVSVISRATSNKYVDCMWGVKPLKEFFPERISTASGEDVSSREVQEAIRHIVDAEDKSAPLSDDRILAQLLEQGYNIKRRTVAKYREVLGIPSSTYRRR